MPTTTSSVQPHILGTVTPSQLAVAIRGAICARQPVFVWGDPGIGKSRIVAEVADRLYAEQYGYSLDANLRVHDEQGRYTDERPWLRDLRLSLIADVDLRGVPFVEDRLTHWAPPAFLPRDGDGVLFLDEMNRPSTPSTMNSAFQLVHDRRVGETSLGDGWAILAAGNEVGFGITSLPDALANRFTHLRLVPNVDDWRNWAIDADVHPMVIAYLSMVPDHLHVYDPKAKALAFPTPRAWERVSHWLQQQLPPEIEFALIQGTIGQAMAIEFRGFVATFRDLPTPDEILAHPDTAKVPNDVAALYAVAMRMARGADALNFAAVVTYLDRLPIEYATMAMKAIQRRAPELQKTKSFTQWALAHDETFNLSSARR